MTGVAVVIFTLFKPGTVRSGAPMVVTGVRGGTVTGLLFALEAPVTKEL